MRMRSGAAALLPILLFGCDAGTWLAFREIPSFREVDAEEGRALAARAGAQLLQVGRAPRSLAAREGARVVEADWEWPPGLAAGGPVVIVAARPEDGLRLAARMARAGIQQVVVVAGGLEAWNREPTLAAAGPKTMRE